MFPFQVIVLLLLAGMPETLPEGSRLAVIGAHWPRAWLAAAFLGAHLLIVLAACVRGRRFVRALHTPRSDATELAVRIDRLFNRARWTGVALTGLFLIGSPLPAAVGHVLARTTLLRHLPLLPESLLIGPAMVSWIAYWGVMYFFESAIRERSLPYRLAQGLPAHDMPTLGQYLSLQIRHTFFILVPIFLHASILAAGRVAGRWVPYAEDIAAPLGIVAVLLTVPWLVVHIWSTVPLAGPLRDRLEGVAAAYRVRFRNILLWKTHNAVTNAAILGWVPFARYFLMTDALLESLSDEQIEAVFAHEVGHGAHRHILWYLGAFLGILGIAGAAGIFWSLYPPPLPSWAGLSSVATPDTVGTLLSLGLIGLFLGVVFPRISHRFEHQADWFASRHMARAAASAAGSTEGREDALPPGVMTLAQYLSTEFAPAGASPAPPSPSEAPGAVAPSPWTAPPPPAAGGLIGLQPAVDADGPPADLPAAPTPASPARPIARVTPAQAGAEVFISALDTIIEIAHRSRDKKGWMHPSINNRIGLLRTLAVDPAAVDRFDRRQRRTRLLIAGLFVVGTVCSTLATYASVIHDRQAAQTQPAATQQ
jgi:Zn-dependent protease with chaperone function